MNRFSTLFLVAPKYPQWFPDPPTANQWVDKYIYFGFATGDQCGGVFTYICTKPTTIKLTVTEVDVLLVLL